MSLIYLSGIFLIRLSFSIFSPSGYSWFDGILCMIWRLFSWFSFFRVVIPFLRCRVLIKNSWPLAKLPACSASLGWFMNLFSEFALVFVVLWSLSVINLFFSTHQCSVWLVSDILTMRLLAFCLQLQNHPPLCAPEFPVFVQRLLCPVRHRKQLFYLNNNAKTCKSTIDSSDVTPSWCLNSA